MQRLSVLFATTAAFVILPAPLPADVTDPDAVIVTATRTAVTADESLASVTVLEREDIERSQARSLPELLRGIPGVDLSISGGYGKQTSLFLRGTNSGHVLVLIDGVKIGSATTAPPSWEFLPLSQIDRIEIVRGPRSSLYGSEAMGGIIQIFTRKGRGPLQPRATVSTGSYNTNEISGGFSGATENTWYNLSASQLTTRGIDAREPVVEFGTLIDQPDRDGYDNRSLSARFGQRFGNGMEIEFHVLHAEGNNEFDSSGNDEVDFTQQAAGAILRFNPMSRWHTSISLGRSLDERLNFRADGTTSRTRFNTKRRQFSWQNDVSVAKGHVLTLGYDYLEDLVDSTTAYDRNSRDNAALFGQYQGNLGRHDLLVSLRTDDNEQFGQQSTGNIGWGYALTDRYRLIASYGTAFKAPTFNDLYFPGFSNPNLKPEESKSIEVGLKSKEAGMNWAVYAYRTTIDNLITLDSSFIPQNISKANIKGLEVEVSTTVAGWTASAGLSFIDPRDESTGKQLARRAKKSAKLDLDRRLGRMRFGIGLIAQGPRFDDAANTKRIGGYTVLNLRALYPLSRNWQVRGRIENLLDKEYQTIKTFNSPGRSIFITLAYQPRKP